MACGEHFRSSDPAQEHKLGDYSTVCADPCNVAKKKKKKIFQNLVRQVVDLSFSSVNILKQALYPKGNFLDAHSSVGSQALVQTG